MTIILVDNSNLLEMKILTKRVETAFRDINIPVIVRVCNENIFESVKAKNDDFEYIICSIDNTSKEFRMSLQRSILATSNSNSLFYFTTGSADIEQLIINDEFTALELKAVIQELKKRQEANQTNIDLRCNNIKNAENPSTEGNMAISNLINQKATKQEAESSLLEIVNKQVDDASPDITPEITYNKEFDDFTVQEENFKKTRLRQDAQVSSLNHIEDSQYFFNNDKLEDDSNIEPDIFFEGQIERDKTKDLIETKDLNEQFLACLNESYEKQLAFLDILKGQQERRVHIFTELKDKKLSIDNLVEDMLQNRQKYENGYLETERVELKKLRDKKLSENLNIGESITKIQQTINLSQLQDYINVVQEQLLTLQTILSQEKKLVLNNLKIVDLTAKIDEPVIQVINYEDELKKKRKEQEVINETYFKIKREGTMIHSLKMGLQALCKANVNQKSKNNFNCNSNEIFKEDKTTYDNSIKQKEIDVRDEVTYYGNNSKENVLESANSTHEATITLQSLKDCGEESNYEGSDTNLQDALDRSISLSGKTNFFGNN